MRSFMLALKIEIMTQGIRLSDSARDDLSNNGTTPLTLHEYATTGGVTLRMGDVYLNAPFDEEFCIDPQAALEFTGSGYAVHWGGVATPAEVLPLPAYVGVLNSLGQQVTATTMSHCDRIRISPIMGCTLDCTFCDMPLLKDGRPTRAYTRHSIDELLASIEVAKADPGLPPHHLLISGGSPGPRHFEWFDETVCEIAARCGLATDVMMSPRSGGLEYVARYVDAGVTGFSLNLEVFGEDAASRIMPRKHALSTPHFVRTATAAVDLLGHGTGAVRSIVIVGLDDLDTTLRAVELIASLGADPVLSPFRPALNTPLAGAQPPTADFLRTVHDRSLEIADRHSVALGPRCIPCQHNTLVVPDHTQHWYAARRYAA
jgi:pyruvate-formate lyase-activating enzyme